MKKINWGIIGVGRIAEKFATDLATIDDAQLVACASHSLERARDFANRYNAAHAFGDYESIFSVKDLDVIYIATPHTAHAACTQLCLENNVAVLCEKPFAMNGTEVAQMVKMAREKNVFLMEALWTRFLPATKKVLDIIESGAIGEIKTIHADFGFIPPFLPERRVLNPALGGGAFLDIGLYPAFLSLLLMGYPTDILATSTFGPTGTDETSTFIYKYGNKATASLNCTFGAPTRIEAFIYGTEGYIQMMPKFHETKEIRLYKTDAEPEIFTFERETWGYDFETREVNQCLRNGQTESKLWSLDDSLNLIRLLDETRKTAGIKYDTDK